MKKNRVALLIFFFSLLFVGEAESNSSSQKFQILKPSLEKIRWERFAELKCERSKDGVGLLRDENNNTAPAGFAPTFLWAGEGFVVVTDAYNNQLIVFNVKSGKREVFKLPEDGLFWTGFIYSGKLWAVSSSGNLYRALLSKNTDFEKVKKLPDFSKCWRVYPALPYVVGESVDGVYVYDLSGKLIKTFKAQYKPLIYNKGYRVYPLHTTEKVVLAFSKNRVISFDLTNYVWSAGGDRNAFAVFLFWPPKDVKIGVFKAGDFFFVKPPSHLSFDTLSYVWFDGKSLWWHSYDPLKDRYVVWKGNLK